LRCRTDVPTFSQVGSTPTGVPFTFLDTKSNQIQGVMVDIITEIRAASEASADSIRGLRTVGSIPRERRGVAPHQCRGANDLRLLLDEVRCQECKRDGQIDLSRAAFLACGDPLNVGHGARHDLVKPATTSGDGVSLQRY